MKVTHHHIDLPTVHYCMGRCHTQTHTHTTSHTIYKQAHLLVLSPQYTHTSEQGVKNLTHTCIWKTTYRSRLDAQRQRKSNKLHEKCTAKGVDTCRHTNTRSPSLSHTHTHLSEHEWRRQSVHTGSSWSWMCQSQQLNASLDRKVSN